MKTQFEIAVEFAAHQKTVRRAKRAQAEYAFQSALNMMLEDDSLSIDLVFCEIQTSLRQGEADYRAFAARAEFKKWNNAIAYRASNKEDATIF